MVDQIDIINYGINQQSNVQIKKETTGFFDTKNAIPPNVIFKDWNGMSIPIFFDENDYKEIITEKDGQVIINYDIIASAFYLLSGWQEYYSNDKDNFGRFPYQSSIQHKYNFTEIPVVNYYFDILKVAIEKSFKINVPYRSESITGFLSHDIDKCNSGWIEDGFFLLKNGNVGSAIKIIFNRSIGQDHWFNFKQIIELEEELDVCSTFFFLPKKDKNNADYSIESGSIKKVINNISNSSSEVGLHGSMGSSTSKEKLALDKSKINKKIFGNRFHYLLYDPKVTPDIIDNLLEYDTTLGFAEMYGFRNSYCHPFYPFDFKHNKAYSYLEIPLNIMDTTFRNYLKLPIAEIEANSFRLIGEVLKFNGIVSILWHNNYFTHYKYNSWTDIYKNLILHIKSKGGKFQTGKNIYDIYSKLL